MATNTLKQKLAEGKWVSGPIVEEVRTGGMIKMLALAGHGLAAEGVAGIVEEDRLVGVGQQRGALAGIGAGGCRGRSLELSSRSVPSALRRHI